MGTPRQPDSRDQPTHARRCLDERGAILVHVAVAFVGLMAFSVMTIDMGVVWVARTQAQSAADAAALAGAVSLAYGDPGNVDSAREAARALAAANPVWNEPPNLVVGSDITTGACPAGLPAAGECLQVHVERTAGNGNPLPVYFAPLLGVMPADVRARATAQVVPANSTACLKPWAIPDTWLVEAVAPADEFNPPGDIYTPPSAGGGYSVGVSTGSVISINMTTDVGVVQRYGYLPLDLDNMGPGGNDQYVANITGCAANPVSIESLVPVQQYDPDDAADAAQDIINLGPEPSNRVVALALYDPAEYHSPGGPGVAGWGASVHIRNIIGFHLDSVAGNTITGRLVPLAGTRDTRAPDLTADASFLRAVTLVR